MNIFENKANLFYIFFITNSDVNIKNLMTYCLDQTIFKMSIVEMAKKLKLVFSVTKLLMIYDGYL